MKTYGVTLTEHTSSETIQSSSHGLSLKTSQIGLSIQTIRPSSFHLSTRNKKLLIGAAAKKTFISPHESSVHLSPTLSTDASESVILILCKVRYIGSLTMTFGIRMGNKVRHFESPPRMQTTNLHISISSTMKRTGKTTSGHSYLLLSC